MSTYIIGGGAAGFFAAITCAGQNPDTPVILLERGGELLNKVRISGGGRCNVTHACFDVRQLLGFYPRGHRELNGPFSRFGPRDTIEWFERRGVVLKTEADGRMFPDTDDSATIVNCLRQAARQAGVEVKTHARVSGLNPVSGGWQIHLTEEAAPIEARQVLMATGSNLAAWRMIEELGHKVVPPVPSLFTFNISDPRLHELSGLSVADAHVQIGDTKLKASGPLLITHWGLSGPGILRISAWGARELHAMDYHFTLKINWLGNTSLIETGDRLRDIKASEGKKQVSTHARFGLPLRLWQRLCQYSDIPEEMRWADLDKKRIAALSAQLCEGQFQAEGKSTYKDEFVTAGGIDLKEVNLKTFESKLHPGLFFAGEVLDIDAVTGGFNFQAAWTSGWIAGMEMAGRKN